MVNDSLSRCGVSVSIDIRICTVRERLSLRTIEAGMVSLACAYGSLHFGSDYEVYEFDSGDIDASRLLVRHSPGHLDRLSAPLISVIPASIYDSHDHE